MKIETRPDEKLSDEYINRWLATARNEKLITNYVDDQTVTVHLLEELVKRGPISISVDDSDRWILNLGGNKTECGSLGLCVAVAYMFAVGWDGNPNKEFAA